jgi:hypothetical protein
MAPHRHDRRRLGPHHRQPNRDPRRTPGRSPCRRQRASPTVAKRDAPTATPRSSCPVARMRHSAAPAKANANEDRGHGSTTRPTAAQKGSPNNALGPPVAPRATRSSRKGSRPSQSARQISAARPHSRPAAAAPTTCAPTATGRSAETLLRCSSVGRAGLRGVCADGVRGRSRVHRTRPELDDSERCRR